MLELRDDLGRETQPLEAVGIPEAGGGLPAGMTIWLPVRVTGPLMVPLMVPTESLSVVPDVSLKV